ncbi:MAG TPA: hypothetical protein DDX39_04445 [Bacteroidales bacterium]|nr:MAG: hypothetical protein A2W98_10555 [Bacteroidetes bacterium GWF2_33_38]OFY73228.1 MAG: hypothetical protein A2265_02115 [Bacteroidetes bacterium RIFOXYA12_FULL_33_9]HBF87873.1 hypothetical protein [Bacteroidales bacterium]
MKSLNLILILVILSLSSKSQIVYEHSYNAIHGNLQGPILLSHSGHKYQFYDNNTYQLILYNLNHSIFRTINVPFNPSYNYNGSIFYVSETIFDTDSSNIEYVRLGADSVAGIYRTEIINEDGSFLMTLDSGAVQIAQTDSGAKMIFQATDYSTFHRYDIYSLPGYIPTPCCNNNSINTTLTKKETQNNNFFGYPNPTNDFVKIDYKLPENITNGKIVFYNLAGQFIKQFNIDNNFDHLLISTQDLSAGSYYYSLQTKNEIIGTKKLIVIK